MNWLPLALEGAANLLMALGTLRIAQLLLALRTRVSECARPGSAPLARDRIPDRSVPTHAILGPVGFGLSEGELPPLWQAIFLLVFLLAGGHLLLLIMGRTRVRAVGTRGSPRLATRRHVALVNLGLLGMAVVAMWSMEWPSPVMTVAAGAASILFGLLGWWAVGPQASIGRRAVQAVCGIAAYLLLHSWIGAPPFGGRSLRPLDEVVLENLESERLPFALPVPGGPSELWIRAAALDWLAETHPQRVADLRRRFREQLPDEEHGLWEALPVRRFALRDIGWHKAGTDDEHVREAAISAVLERWRASDEASKGPGAPDVHGAEKNDPTVRAAVDVQRLRIAFHAARLGILDTDTPAREGTIPWAEVRPAALRALDSPASTIWKLGAPWCALRLHEELGLGLPEAVAPASHFDHAWTMDIGFWEEELEAHLVARRLRALRGESEPWWQPFTVRHLLALWLFLLVGASVLSFGPYLRSLQTRAEGVGGRLTREIENATRPEGSTPGG